MNDVSQTDRPRSATLTKRTGKIRPRPLYQPAMFDTRNLAQRAQEAGKVFALRYNADTGPRSVNAFLVRHRNDDGSPDEFTAHLAATGEWLGYGETKQDPEQCARIHLHQWADFGIPFGRGTPSIPRE